MKAILVVDMPEIDEDTKNGCRHCRYADCGSIGFFESYTCRLTDQNRKVYDMKCPLKPIPKCRYYRGNERDFTDGFNACINEILGENK